MHVHNGGVLFIRDVNGGDMHFYARVCSCAVPTPIARTRAENKCTCAGGTGATGTACPTHNAAKCASCTDASQYVDTNNECAACPPGSTCNGVTATGASG